MQRLDDAGEALRADRVEEDAPVEHELVVDLVQDQRLLDDPLFTRINSRIVPGDQLGEATLDMDVERARPYALSVALNNYRPPSIDEKGYEVAGLSRGGPERSLGCSEHLRERLKLLWCDLRDSAGLHDAIAQVHPHELYHLASPSFVPASWEHPRRTLQAIAGSAAAILETVGQLDPQIRVFLASSISMFGDARLRSG